MKVGQSALTLEQPQNALKMLDDGKSGRAVAEFLNVGKGTINRTNPIAWPFSCMWTRQVKSLRTQDTKAAVVVPKYEDIDTAVIEFLKLARDRGMPVTGPMLRTLAEREASGVEGVKASEGRLSKEKARHGICGRALSGDAAGVKKVVLENWEEDFPRIIGSYKPEDIYNLDETGFYFRATTTKSLVLPKDTAHGIKQDKSGLTLMVCTFMLGEKEKLLLIWKSEKPRALKGADMSKLPVVYKGHIFCSWMKLFDNIMHNSGRRILIFMDNASVHKASDELSLKAVQLVYFPSNATSCTQPLDAGIIPSLNCYTVNRCMSIY